MLYIYKIVFSKNNFVISNITVVDMTILYDLDHITT